MAKKPNTNLNFGEFKKLYEDNNKNIDQMLLLLQKEQNVFEKIFDWQTKISNLELKRTAQEAKIQKILNEQNQAKEIGFTTTNRTIKKIKERVEIERRILRNTGLQIKGAKAIQSTLKGTVDLIAKGAMFTKGGFWEFLMTSDKAIKQTNLELGLSGEKAQLLRTNFEDAAGFAGRLGVSVKDLSQIQSRFTDETGRARVLTEGMLEDIVQLGKGTGLGVDNAARLVGQFDLMGVNVNQALMRSQEIIDVSERMGVSATKVFSNISKNFKTLQKFTFQQGVKGFGQMAAYSEKFKVDMGQMLDSAENARTLEGAVKLAAQLQVMGGEFAKTDPFELLFLSRNDPAAYTQKINEMTKGIVTWKKNAEGGFEKFISPADRDRLEAVGKSLGLQSGQLIEQSLRMADITKMRRQMVGVGVNKEQRELVEGMAQLGENGQFTVNVGSEIKNLSRLTSTDLELLKQQSSSLEQRALAAQTFDEAFKATILELKASLMPLLQGVNKVLGVIRPIMVGFGEWVNELSQGWKTGLMVTGGLLAGAAVLSRAFLLGRALISSFTTKSAATGVVETMTRDQMIGKGRGAMMAGKGAGAAAMGKGIGVGAGALGIGGGMLMASKGIASIADSLQGLNKDQLDTLKWISTVMPVAMGAGAIGLIVFGKAAEFSAIGLGVLTVATLGLGAGIGLASAGIGYMAEGISKLAQPEVAANLKGVAGGMAALVGTMAAGGVIGLLGSGGMITTLASISAIATKANDIERIGNAFGSIGTVMSGNMNELRELQEIITSISTAKMTENSVISQLSELLNKPLMVQFDDKTVAMNVELNMDGTTVFKKIFDANVSARKHTDAQNGIRTST